jgi:radical SAM superfamily enzyme YgiQ (UPF0313 family)
VLVGLFRSIVPEGGETPYGSQGGFVDTLAPRPYSLANGYLKAFADEAPELAGRHSLELLDLAQPLELEDEREEYTLTAQDLERVLARDPDVVGLSGYCWNAEALAECARMLKQRRPELLVIAGGRATEGEPEALLRDCPALDALVLGEGEIAFRELLRRDFTGLQDCPGLVYRDGPHIRFGAPARAVQDLDEIPSPYLKGVVQPARDGMMMELSRGCLHACGYCTWNANKQLRFFGAERIEREVRWAVEQGHGHITLNDSAINYDTAWLARHVQAIRRGDPQGTLRFTYNLRHDRVDDEQLALLAGLPTHMVLCGVETLQPEGMREVERAPVNSAALREVLARVGEAVRPPVVSIVLGLPGDNEAGFLRTLDTLLSWCDGARPAAGAVLVSLLQVYRGSGLWHRRESLGLEFEPRGIPYLLQGGGWTPQSLASARKGVLERMARRPGQLKAAEAIALLSSRGELPEWLSPALLQQLVAPWRLGEEHHGWTFEKTGVMRDTGQGGLLRFRWRDGGGVRLKVTRRAGPGPARFSTEKFDLQPVALHGPVPPREAASWLMKVVYSAVLRNEHGAPR